MPEAPTSDPEAARRKSAIEAFHKRAAAFQAEVKGALWDWEYYALIASESAVDYEYLTERASLKTIALFIIKRWL